jgi:hypothetical protein
MYRQSNMNRNTIGAGQSTQKSNSNKIMIQAIEITLGTTAGKSMFQNLTQLDGAVITQMSILPPKVSDYSAQTYSANIPTLADFKAMFFTFMRQDTQTLENIPALMLNPFNDNDSTAATTIPNNNFWKDSFSPQIIDFNKSYIWMANTPSAAGLKVSLLVSYYYSI